MYMYDTKNTVISNIAVTSYLLSIYLILCHVVMQKNTAFIAKKFYYQMYLSLINVVYTCILQISAFLFE